MCILELSEMSYSLSTPSSPKQIKSDVPPSFSFTGHELEALVVSCFSVFGNDIVGERGQIASPQWPRSYPPNSNYQWRISVNASQVIHGRILQMDIEDHHRCQYDNLKVISFWQVILFPSTLVKWMNRETYRMNGEHFWGCGVAYCFCCVVLSIIIMYGKSIIHSIIYIEYIQ